MAQSTKSSAKDNTALQKYYGSFDVRVGAGLVLGGRRHLGYYDSRESWPIPVRKALRRMEDQLYDALEAPAGGVVLDAGCGNGKVAIHLAKKGLQVDAIDAVQKHVRRAKRHVARKRLTNQITVDLGDYHKLDKFVDDAYDGVYTMETLVHATDPEKALREFKRVLKPGGRVAHFEYDHIPVSEMSKVQRNSFDLLNKQAAMPAHETFEQGALEQMLRNVGFENVQLKDFSENVEPMFRLFYMLAYYPYLLIVYLGIQSWFTNIVNMVEMYEQAEAGVYRYVVVTARKPLGSGGSGDQGALRRRN